MKDYIEYTVRVFKDRKEWWLSGNLHREDGPVIEREDGTKEWWLNGKRHREDGPAIERADGTKLWYLNGIRFFEEDFNKKIKKRNNKNSYDNKVVEIDGKKYRLTEI